MSSSDPFSGPRDTSDPTPPLLLRWIQLAGWPPAWGRAARWSWVAALAPVAAWVVFAPSVLLVGRGVDARLELTKTAASWDAELPRISVVDGHVRVAGDRVVRVDEGGRTMLLDVKETVPLETLTASEYFVVHETELIRKQPFRTTITPVAELQGFVGGHDVVLDSASLLAFDQKWGAIAAIGITLLMLCFSVPGTALLTAISGGVSLIGVLPVARARGLGGDGAVKVAIAASVPGIWLSTIAAGLGVWPGSCLGVPVLAGITFVCATLGILSVERPAAAAPP